ncbi:hypothetical protein [Achromobacter deleyi]|uniref:hypothetical protein n=1 Tax=Achromobacter deleyi TaxID=1353891 RepID=UPI001492130D|nr:hypothetical protein [Achromobacter deleyi]QVQ24730.1 hypothetical protein HLG70_17755 [Achromobacter deleyi]UIP20268.1 hypothetical protein LYZ39_25370 [Achromobacter deleyi]
MAENIVSMALIEDLLFEVAPGLDEDGEGHLHSLTALLRPALEAVIRGYQIASMQETTEAAFRRFVERLAQEG